MNLSLRALLTLLVISPAMTWAADSDPTSQAGSPPPGSPTSRASEYPERVPPQQPPAAQPVLPAPSEVPPPPTTTHASPEAAPPGAAHDAEARPPVVTPPPSMAAPAPPPPRSEGQWVYTNQYGWVWMPYAQAYTYVPADGGYPYMFVYYPTSGWRWVVAPWVFGWGPRPYWGPWGRAHFVWYAHPWFRMAPPHERHGAYHRAQRIEHRYHSDHRR
jgi:hypothetical protein